MNLLTQTLAHQAREGEMGPTGYAWVITKDHLARTPSEDETGTMGPHDAPAHLIALLKQGEGTVFKMYDDDGELYYTGRMVATEDWEGTEDACAGPLDDFGAPNAGAVRIDYRTKPEWNIG